MHHTKLARLSGVSLTARSVVLAGASLVAVLFAAAPAMAQQAQAADPAATQADQAGGFEELVVMARRRSEKIQEVPLAVSAVTADSLRATGIDTVAELPLAAPALTSTPQSGGGRSSTNFAIRGLSQHELSILGDQSVSTYIGDVPVARVQGVNSTFFDIGSIEILRGPQGTLFGRNTTGGAVVIRPNKPVDNFEGMVAVTLGNLGTVNTEGMVNIPLTEGLSFRVAGRTMRDDGYVHDALLGRNVDFTRQQAVRASLLMQIEPDVEVLTTYEYFHENDGGVGTFLAGINAAASNNAPAFRAARGYRPLETLFAEQQARGIYKIASGTPAFVKIDTHLVSNTISWNLSDEITVKNVLAYRKVKDDLRDDLDGTESSIFPQQRIDNSWQFSEELQIMGNHDRFNWIAGLYFFKERGRLKAYSSSNAVDPGRIEYTNVPEYPDASLSLTDVEGANKSYAVFAQGTYELADKLRLTVGGRYTRDKRESIIRNRLPRGNCRFTIDDDGNPATPEVLPTLANCRVASAKSFSEPTYNISLDYRFGQDQLVYIAHRHGYRSGGFGSRAATEAGLGRTYRPETVDDVEIGLKADWRLGGSFLRTNLAAYYADYKDIQRVLTDATITPVQAVTVNAGKARIQGIEAEILFRPISWIDLIANYAYTDAKFKKFETPAGVDLSASTFSRAPKHVYSLGVKVTPPIPSHLGEISFGGNYYFHDKYNADDMHVVGVTDMPSYSLINLNANWDNVLGSNMDLSAAVTNLAKKRYSYYVANLLGLGVLPHFAAEPRRFMVTAKFRFGD